VEAKKRFVYSKAAISNSLHALLRPGQRVVSVKDTDSGTSLLYLETPTNPTLRVLDLPRLIAAGHAQCAIVMVDNTFATPITQLPLALGVGLVVHSATKFLGGHAGALGGSGRRAGRPGEVGVWVPRNQRRGA
jgi:cystathionine gamma-synthase